MSAERLLLGSGPSNAVPEALQALSRPLVGYLDPSFLTLLDELAERLREVFSTKNRMTFAVSGTGSAGMEASLVNVLEPGDTAIVGVNGVFGTRMADVASRAGAEVVRVESDWGQIIRPEDVRAALEAHPEAKVFSLVHAETSTGVSQPMDEIASLVRDHAALFVLDTVTSLSGMPVDVDGWGVDVAYSGTQKCLSVPPGLAPISFSDRAMEAARSRKAPARSWYLDVTLIDGFLTDRVYHHTPPIPMLRALHAGLGSVLDEGLPQRWERHERAASLLAKGLLDRGFTYVPPEDHRLPMLHCVRLPAGVDDVQGRSALLEDYGIEVSGGIGAFKGECWRIGLMGYNATERNVLTLLAALDDVLQR